MSFSIKKLFSVGSSDGSTVGKTKDKAPLKEQPVGPINTNTELEGAETSKEQGWIGIDLDGTLAYFSGWAGYETIGDPVPGIKERVLEWIAQGYKVKIFTARASVPEGIAPIKLWLEKNGFPALEITCSKDFNLIELWDDRAIQVVPNTGSPVISPRWAAKPRAPLFGLERNAKPGHEAQTPKHESNKS